MTLVLVVCIVNCSVFEMWGKYIWVTSRRITRSSNAWKAVPCLITNYDEGSSVLSWPEECWRCGIFFISTLLHNKKQKSFDWIENNSYEWRCCPGVVCIFTYGNNALIQPLSERVTLYLFCSIFVQADLDLYLLTYFLFWR